MNSTFANIYRSLLDKINTLTVSDPPVPAIKYIDMDYGQLEQERPPASFPCLFIDFQDWRFTNEAKLAQIAEGNIVMKLAVNPYSSTSSITPEEARDMALYILDLESRLYVLLNGFRATSQVDPNDPTVVVRQTTPLIRTATISDNRRPGLKVKEITFRCTFTDLSAMPQYRTIPRPKIDIVDDTSTPI